MKSIPTSIPVRTQIFTFMNGRNFIPNSKIRQVSLILRDLSAQPTEVELVIAADDNGGGAAAECRYTAAEPWVRRMETVNLMLAE